MCRHKREAASNQPSPEKWIYERFDKILGGGETRMKDMYGVLPDIPRFYTALAGVYALYFEDEKKN